MDDKIVAVLALNKYVICWDCLNYKAPELRPPDPYEPQTLAQLQDRWPGLDWSERGYSVCGGRILGKR